MTEDERRALGLRHRLAFQNVVNDVPADRIRTDLRMSQEEVDRSVAHVARKIGEYLAIRRQPPILCQTQHDRRWNRLALLAVLARIGDLDLSSVLMVVKVEVQQIDHPEMVTGAKARMAEAYGNPTR